MEYGTSQGTQRRVTWIPWGSLEGMACSNGRFALWIIVSIAVVVGGALLSTFSGAQTYIVNAVSTFLSGAILALCIQSYALNGQERRRRQALHRFWGGFQDDVVIVIPTSNDIVDPSPFTPLQDAIAVSELRDFLLINLNARSTVTAADKDANLDTLKSHNLIIIGGPKFNRVADQFMARLLKDHRMPFYHWTWHLLHETCGERAIADRVKSEGHFMLSVGSREGVPIIHDEIHDVSQSPDATPIEARGFALWTQGYLHPGRNILLLAGLRSAFGTLAAVRHAMDATALMDLHFEKKLQLIVSAPVLGYDIGSIEELRRVVSNS